MAMTLRLTQNQDAALTLLARTQGLSKQEAAAQAIVETAARHVRLTEIRQLAKAEVSSYRQLHYRLLAESDLGSNE